MTTRSPGEAVGRALANPDAAPNGDAVVANHAAGLPNWAQNRVQRVRDRTCAHCGRPILRASRGPAPRQCVECEVRVRRVRQLRSYLRSAARLAIELDRPSIADAAAMMASALGSGLEP